MSISVVIPCYNVERFVGQAIESALSQSRAPDEIVVVDDGSTDKSAQIAASFGGRVRLIQCAHRGVSAARNVGVSAARGDLIAWLDADDIWEPCKLEVQVPRFADPSVGLVYGQRSLIGYRRSDAPWPVNMPEGDVFEQLYFWCFINTPSVVVRRQALIDAGGFDEDLPIAEDFDAWLRVAISWKFAAVAGITFRYRRRKGQQTAMRAPVVRFMLRAQDKHGPELERRTGMSRSERRQRLARIYLKELSGMIYRRDLTEARVLAAVLEEAFASDALVIRRAIARKRRRATLPKSTFWLRDLVRRSIGW